MTARSHYAPPDVRDRFLVALEAQDRVTSTRLAEHLTSCGNPLPTSTCIELGLPARSSYADAADRVLQRDAADTDHARFVTLAGAAKGACSETR